MRADLDGVTADRPRRLAIETMGTADIRAVLRIEKLSFSTSWPSSAFTSELNDNKLAHYFVGRVPGGEIVAYGGIWAILEDAHVTTIAVHPEWRGKRYGEEMLVHLLREAIARGSSWITLEARQSNRVAQNLYKKYGFAVVAARRAYYSDNGEDAVVMWAGNLRGELYAAHLARLENRLAARIAMEP